VKTFAVIVLVVGLLAACACTRGPELTCRANEVCFVCPNEKEQAKCVRDPASSRCKYAEASHCAK
jgi:hypothetical protein